MDGIPNYTEDLKRNHDKNDVVARWIVPLRGKLYDVELEHGRVTGKRVVWVNGEEILRHDLMYRLVGEETFYLEEKRCIFHIIPSTGFKYSYKLFVEGIEFEHYNQSQQKILKTWEIKINEKTYRVVLEKDSLNIYLNGELREEKAEFVDNGTETRFEADENLFVLCAKMSGDSSGVFYELLLNGVVQEVPEIQ